MVKAASLLAMKESHSAEGIRAREVEPGSYKEVGNTDARIG